MSYTFGAYIAEVLKRKYGGTWSNESKLHPGQKIQTFHIGGNGGEIWPQIKVEKRLRDGEEDNTWHYFQMLAQRLEQRVQCPTHPSEGPTIGGPSCQALGSTVIGSL